MASMTNKKKTKKQKPLRIEEALKICYYETVLRPFKCKVEK